MTNDINKKSNFPLFRIIFGSFGLFFDNFYYSLILGSVFSLIFTFINFISGQSVLCYNYELKKNILCLNNLLVMIVANLLLLFVICIYIRNWYQAVILKKYKFSIKNILPQIPDAKILGILGVFFVSILIALTSGYLLFARVPNPDWRIEVIYFLVVSVGFFVPVFVTPIFSYISFVAEGIKMPKIKDLWFQAKGNMFIIFMSFIGVVIITLLFMSMGLQYFTQLAQNGNLFIVIISEFLHNMVIMFMLAICTNYCYMQKIFLFERS